MFPMITTLEEMRRVRSIVKRSEQRLKRDGFEYRSVPLGMMVEVPAAAISLDTIMEVADFVSIGSNDLVQYLMAADHDNPKVSHLCQPLSPPVLRVLRQIIRTCNWQQAGDVVWRNGRKSPSVSVADGHGLATIQHEPRVHPAHEKVGQHLYPQRYGTHVGQRAGTQDDRAD